MAADKRKNNCDTVSEKTSGLAWVCVCVFLRTRLFCIKGLCQPTADLFLPVPLWKHLGQWRSEKLDLEPIRLEKMSKIRLAFNHLSLQSTASAQPYLKAPRPDGV